MEPNGNRILCPETQEVCPASQQLVEQYCEAEPSFLKRAKLEIKLIAKALVAQAFSCEDSKATGQCFNAQRLGIRYQVQIGQTAAGDLRCPQDKRSKR
ncbi:MAG: hypothetical protein ACREGA_03930 [Candidatus Saccharimonadales bacterium]